MSVSVADLQDYTNLVSYLTPSPPRVLEVDNLPSSLGSSLQYSESDAALGIPKQILVQCFLRARSIFFAPLNDGYPDDGEVQQDGELKEKQFSEERWNATTVMLLWDPNHSTAANYRKHYILAQLSSSTGANDTGAMSVDRIDLLLRELLFLESLLTSPMRNHNKSPTLFNHRFWLLQNSILPNIGPDQKAESSQFIIARLWREELGLVTKAGDKHVANYYAWNYARDVFDLLANRSKNLQGGEDWICQNIKESVEKVKAWCFKHPRDVSGWVFLTWLLEKCVENGSDQGKETTTRTHEEVQGWRGRLLWEGAAVNAFVKHVERLMNL